MTRKALGKGLSALLRDREPTTESDQREIDIDLLDSNRFQPRQVFLEAKLEELAQSIRVHGFIQPIVVRRFGERYQIIAGERRWRAAQRLGLSRVPVAIKSISDESLLEVSLIENIQRENLNPIEEAQAYRRLISEFSASQADVASMVGKDRSSVANTLRLLNLPEEVQGMITAGTVSPGHARALLALTTQKEQVVLARRIVEENMSVRQVEAIVGLVKPRKPNATRARREKPAYLADLEKAFATHLGTRVSINEKRGGKGSIAIEFYSYDDFERLSSIMNIPLPR